MASLELRLEFTDSPQDKSSTGSNFNWLIHPAPARPMTAVGNVGMDLDGRGRAPATGIGVIVHNWPCSMLREEQHTEYVLLHSLHMYCVRRDGAEVATLSLPRSRAPLSLPFQCAIWKLHAKCGGTHHREGTGEERRNPFITGREEQRNAKIHGIQRGFCLLKGGPSL